jgi:hypothetical protein
VNDTLSLEKNAGTIFKNQDAKTLGNGYAVG